MAGDDLPPAAPAVDRRAHRDRSCGETRALAERLLAELAALPDAERAGHLARALTATPERDWPGPARA